MLELYHTNFQTGLVPQNILSYYFVSLFNLTIIKIFMCGHICCDILAEIAHSLHISCRTILIYENSDTLIFLF